LIGHAYDTVIIGEGSMGLTVAEFAKQLGQTVERWWENVWTGLHLVRMYTQQEPT